MLRKIRERRRFWLSQLLQIHLLIYHTLKPVRSLTTQDLICLPGFYFCHMSVCMHLLGLKQLFCFSVCLYPNIFRLSKFFNIYGTLKMYLSESVWIYSSFKYVICYFMGLGMEGFDLLTPISIDCWGYPEDKFFNLCLMFCLASKSRFLESIPGKLLWWKCTLGQRDFYHGSQLSYNNILRRVGLYYLKINTDLLTLWFKKIRCFFQTTLLSFSPLLFLFTNINIVA